jgi:CrcB protein
MFINICLVGAGGAAGCILRYLCQRWLILDAFPIGTLAVNIFGCLLIGIFWGLFTRNSNDMLRLLLVTGFCGGFTTFSSFTYEGIQMMMSDRWFLFITYTGLSVVAGLLATVAGLKISSSIL